MDGQSNSAEVQESFLQTKPINKRPIKERPKLSGTVQRVSRSFVGEKLSAQGILRWPFPFAAKNCLAPKESLPELFFDDTVLDLSLLEAIFSELPDSFFAISIVV